MPDVTDLTDGQFRVANVVSLYPRQLRLHLTKTPIFPEPDSANIVEADFPGYRSQIGVFRRDGDGANATAASVTCRAHFGRKAGGAPAAIRGCAVMWTSPAEETGCVYAETFARPVKLVDAGDGLQIEVSLQAGRSSDGESLAGVVTGFSEVLTWKGGSTLYALTGQDKALAETALGCLDGLVRRDAKLGDLSKRSQRSKVPLVPLDDPELLAAVTLVRRRLALLLKSAT